MEEEPDPEQIRKDMERLELIKQKRCVLASSPLTPHHMPYLPCREHTLEVLLDHVLASIFGLGKAASRQPVLVSCATSIMAVSIQERSACTFSRGLRQPGLLKTATRTRQATPNSGNGCQSCAAFYSNSSKQQQCKHCLCHGPPIAWPASLSLDHPIALFVFVLCLLLLQ